MGNKPLFIDHLDTPNIDNRPKPKTDKSANILIVGLSIGLILLFLALVLIYKELNNGCSVNADTISCGMQQLLLYSPVLFLVGIFIAIIIGSVNYARTLGWFSYFEKNAHVNDSGLNKELNQLRLELNADIAKTIAHSLHSAGWQTVSDDHSNTYKQTVEPKDERDMTEGDNEMDDSKLSPHVWLDNDN